MLLLITEIEVSIKTLKCNLKKISEPVKKWSFVVRGRNACEVHKYRDDYNLTHYANSGHRKTKKWEGGGQNDYVADVNLQEKQRKIINIIINQFPACSHHAAYSLG